MKVVNVTINEETKQINVSATPAVVGVQGLSAFQVWQQHNPEGTYEQWIEALTPQVSFRIEGGDLIMTTPD